MANFRWIISQKVQYNVRHLVLSLCQYPDPCITARSLDPARFNALAYYALIQAIQSTFRSLEMNLERRYKIGTCSVILGELESFRNYKGFCIIFPKMLDVITYYESDNFTESSLHRVFVSEKLKLLRKFHLEIFSRP